MTTSASQSQSSSMNEIYIALILTLVVVLITYLLSRRLRKPLNVVILAGLSEAGKTALFLRVVFNKPKKSVTSLNDNEATIKSLNLKLVDLPGSDRLRGKFWESHRVKANRVVFVIDSTTIENKIRDLSEYLYIMLSDKLVHKHKIKFTIACNKQDLEGAKDKDQIMSLLEKELNAIRETKTGQLGKTSDEEDEDYLLKYCDKGISFATLGVDLIETSVHNPAHLVKLFNRSL